MGVIQGIHQVDDLLAGKPEDKVHALVFQAPGNKIGDVHLPSGPLKILLCQ